MPAHSGFDDDGHFTLANIPFGVVSTPDQPNVKVIATRLGGHVYIIPQLIKNGILKNIPKEAQDALNQPTLNEYASLSKSICQQVRKSIQDALQSNSSSVSQSSYSKSDVTYHVPVTIGDFTDFSCSLDHVQNAAEAMTGQRSTPPCFFHFPPGYTGRCSSIVPTGRGIKRPLGQFRDKSGDVTYGPSRWMDFELEVGAVIGQPTVFGKQVHAKDADQHIFGLVLINDWSARDIQALEMSPLGPLNGKSLGTTISPWIITLDALEPFACPMPSRNSTKSPAPYLQGFEKTKHYAIRTQVHLTPAESNAINVVCDSNFQDLYWPISALVAHQTSNGCPLNTGDLLGTGTISGSTEESHGCLLETTKGGKESITLSSGETRTFLQDGDAVRLTAWAGELGSDSCVGFGECFGVLEKAIEF